MSSIIPNNVQSDKCPICLATILNLTVSGECFHRFCFECIYEWIKQHNRCPMCRRIIRTIRYNIRSNNEYDFIDVMPPLIQPDYVHRITDLFSLIITPAQNGLYLIFPWRVNGVIYYRTQFIPPGETFIVRNERGTLFVLPEDFEYVCRSLENSQILRFTPHSGSHPLFIRKHKRH